MREQNIEQLFRNSFSNFEADVNPNAWANISQQLQAPVPSPEAVGNAASAGKTMGLWGYAGLFVAATAVVVTALVYNSGNESPDETLALKSNPKIEVRLTELHPVEEAPVPVNPAVTQKVQPKNNNNQKSVALVVHQEKETAAEEKQPEVSSSSTIISSTLDNAEVPKNEKIVEAKENPSTPAENNPVVTDDVQPTENDFDFVHEPVDNGIPYEQELRTDFTFYIPNVITPDGDRVNDDFKPMGLNFKDFELVIYDGNSNEIFRSKDIDHKWDGKLKNGVLAPGGTYIYVISVKDLNNVEHPQRGQLLLKR